jgi:hypothetical protein
MTLQSQSTTGATGESYASALDQCAASLLKHNSVMAAVTQLAPADVRCWP